MKLVPNNERWTLGEGQFLALFFKKKDPHISIDSNRDAITKEDIKALAQELREAADIVDEYLDMLEKEGR